MSHNIMIKGVKFVDERALEKAVEELAAEGVRVSLNRSGTFRTWPGQPNQCDITIALPGEKYDVGLVKQPDGSFQPVFDNDLSRGNGTLACEWSPGQAREQATIAKLHQRYGVCLTERELALEGHCVVRSKGKDGEIILEAEYT